MAASSFSFGSEVSFRADNDRFLRGSETLKQTAPKDLSEQRYHELLASNSPPNDSELAAVGAVLPNTRAHLNRLAAEISQLQTHLRELERQHDQLSTVYGRQKGIVSLLRRMPPEVLGEIFAWTLPFAGTRLPRRRMTDGPWVLTHVCREWRILAIGISSLWSFVDLDFFDNPDAVYPVPMLEMQISRAQRLNIRFRGCNGVQERPQMTALFCLVQHAPLWEAVNLYLTSASLVPILMGLRERMPCLRRLSIGWDDRAIATDMESMVGIQTMDCFLTAPNLVDASIYKDCSTLTNLLPAHQLTRYELECSWTTHLALLKLSSKLVQARIIICEDDWDKSLAGAEDLVWLPSLRRLYVSHVDILDFVVAPGLKDLSLWLWEPDLDGSVSQRIVHSALIQSCKLHGLHLGGGFAPPAVALILRDIRSIVDLKVTVSAAADVNATADMMSDLTAMANKTLAPQLRGIHLAAKNAYFYAEYLDMLESRWYAMECDLERTTLAAESNLEPGFRTYSKMRMLEREGLGFSFLLGNMAVETIYDWALSYRHLDGFT